MGIFFLLKVSRELRYENTLGDKPSSQSCNNMIGYTSGASVVIDDGEGGRYVSVIPVDGHCDSMDSFRAESVRR